MVRGLTWSSQNAPGADSALGQDGGQDAFGLGQLLPEDGSSGPGMPWATPSLVPAPFTTLSSTAVMGKDPRSDQGHHPGRHRLPPRPERKPHGVRPDRDQRTLA
jgi:hypothetical protein